MLKIDNKNSHAMHIAWNTKWTRNESLVINVTSTHVSRNSINKQNIEDSLPNAALKYHDHA